jgi:hypothetical protein
MDGGVLVHDLLVSAATKRKLAPAPAEAPLRANGVPVLALIGQLDPRHSGENWQWIFPYIQIATFRVALHALAKQQTTCHIEPA